MRTVLEICCGSAYDAIEACNAGADRVELNCDMFHGGLTPSLGTLKVVRSEAPQLKIMAMVRPREGGFCYSDTEFRTAVEDAELFLKNGADGIVFGFLNGDGSIDYNRTRLLAQMAAGMGKESVFSRAIDVVPDWKSVLDALIDIGITRVLTSGQHPTAFEGMDTIKSMIRHASGRIEILPGAGIRLNNMRAIIEHTGCTQIHLSAHRSSFDHSAANDRSIHYGGCLYPDEVTDRAVDFQKVADIVEGLAQL